MNFDFFKLRDKYPVLSESDLSFLNGFFNQDLILAKFAELEKIRKKRMYTTYIICIIVDVLFLIFWLNNGISGSPSIFINLFFIDVVIFVIIGFFFKNINSEVKKEIIDKLATTIDPNLKYSGTDSYCFDENIFIKKGLLKNYDRLDLKEDSIEYDYSLNKDVSGGFKINGFEFKTSVRHKDNKGNTSYTTNNHAYLLKIAFNNPIRRVEKEITLRKDINDSKITILSISALLTLVSVFLIYILSLIIAGDAVKQFHYNNYSGSVITWIVSIISIFIIVRHYTIKYLNNNRVKLENMEFEKKFDVYCEDQIDSRKILTPNFMYKILDYTNKMKDNRIYEFYFLGHEIYIKRDLMNTGGKYMEISLFKNLLQNAEQLIQFYIELKNSASLANDLGLYYFDKETVNNKIIEQI